MEKGFVYQVGATAHCTVKNLHLEIDEARGEKKSTTIDLSKCVREWELRSNASVLHYFAVIHLLFIFYYYKMGLLPVIF